ncbi:right-handed parallel beta-helix repeat-containing protein [Microcoleus sp. FACHB-SPT15]|uniref:right-handed parallel beta-helix repeat-containing protein n=1 Tax=Microcoleus sp. FACHB-SPT15 TaxID=2692830 RepID=UPI001784C666|nr:right-handed parallel beta-helix repeat-containing protein [Microcoleus sp. FACHB-SPT15]MBD1804226.1 right-handed parallel beta-helix repeat-containing protein [Microcoleus sp. FACHB-SPT15]
MPTNKLMRCLYITCPLLGALTSNAVAQTIEGAATDLPKTTGEATLSNTPDSLAESEQTSQNQAVSTWVAEPETTLTSETVKPEFALSPDIVSAPQPENNPTSDTAQPEFTPIPATVLAPKSEIMSTPERVEPEFALSPIMTFAPDSKTVEDVTPSPDVESEASLLSQTTDPEPVLPTSETAQNPPIKVLPRFGGNFTTGSGVGYSSSFGSLEGFVPLSQTPGSNLTFLEGRLLLSTEDFNLGGNLVLGHRVYNAEANRVLGGYIAFDNRSTGNSSFNQVGVGFESLGESWEVRGNAYVPVGNTRQLTAETISDLGVSASDPFFQDNFLAVTRNQQQQLNRRFEAAMTGVDLEAGVKLASLGQTGPLRGYAGLYYYDAPDSDEVLGWRTRLEARPTDTLRLGLALSNDATFGTNLVVSVGANFPGTRPRGLSQDERVLARLGESPQRNANIVVDEQVESELLTMQDTVFVTNPFTGEPWRFQHVNLGLGTGNGTVETPTATVAEALAVAQPNDIVYVQPGTAPAIPAFTIPDGVQVLSTAPVQRIDTVELGNVQLPLSGAGALPEVTGTVTLGNDTTLSGFAVNAVPGAGIVGTNINNIVIRENAIANSTAEGISLSNVSAQVEVTDNTISNSGREGFNLNNNLGEVELVLAGNTITDNGALAADGDGVNVELRNDATGTFDLTNNTITNNLGRGGIADGVDFKLFDNASGTANLTDNTISGNQLNGINLDLEATTSGTLNLTGNTITGNESGGLDVLVSNDASGTFNLTGNTISNNKLRGVALAFADRTTGSINLTDNTISENQDDGVYLQLSDQAQLNANLSNNLIARNANNGIFTSTNGTAQLRFLSELNMITDNGFTGLSLITLDSARTLAAIRASTLTGSNFSDIEVLTIAPGTTACLQPTNNTIGSLILDDSVGGPIQVEAGTLPTNNISTSDFTFWSGTAVSPGTCGF